VIQYQCLWPGDEWLGQPSDPATGELAYRSAKALATDVVLSTLQRRPGLQERWFEGQRGRETVYITFIMSCRMMARVVA
jgi:hypothetical protein